MLLSYHILITSIVISTQIIVFSTIIAYLKISRQAKDVLRGQWMEIRAGSRPAFGTKIK